MKKLIIAAIILIALIGCEKEIAVEPVQEPEPIDCHCGKAYKRGGTWTIEGRQTQWTYMVLNNCTNAPIYINTRQELQDTIYCKDYQW